MVHGKRVLKKKGDENVQPTYINDECKNEAPDHNTDINISIHVQNKNDYNNLNYNKNNSTDAKNILPSFKNNLLNAAQRLLYNESINETLFNNLKNIKNNFLKLEEEQDEYKRDGQTLGNFENVTNMSLSYQNKKKKIIEHNKIYSPEDNTKTEINYNNDCMINNVKEYKKNEKEER